MREGRSQPVSLSAWTGHSARYVEAARAMCPWADGEFVDVMDSSLCTGSATTLKSRLAIPCT